jgi:hypothetical protein
MLKVLSRLKPEPQVAIKPTVVPVMTAVLAAAVERVRNLGASDAEQQMVADGIARGVVANVSAYSLDAHGQACDAAVLDVRRDRADGRTASLDTSGRHSIVEQIDRGDAELLKDQMRRFSRAGRTTRVQLEFTPEVYADPELYRRVQASLKTTAAEAPAWRNGGARERVAITPAKLGGSLVSRDLTARRRPR